MVLSYAIWPYFLGMLSCWLFVGWGIYKYYLNKTVIESEPEKASKQHVIQLAEERDHLKQELIKARRLPEIDLLAALKAGIPIDGENDFTIIAGINRDISELLHSEGVTTFRQLSGCKALELVDLLDEYGKAFQVKNLLTWPDQALLAANNRWIAFMQYQQSICVEGINTGFSNSVLPAMLPPPVSDAVREKHIVNKEIVHDLCEEFQTSPPCDEFDVEGNQHDFTVIYGIGETVNTLLHERGINTFQQLAATPLDELEGMLKGFDILFVLAKPEDWLFEAHLIANNHWRELKQLHQKAI